MEKFNRQTMRRWLSVFLAVMLILPQTPAAAGAEIGAEIGNQKGIGICPHPIGCHSVGRESGKLHPYP